MADADLEAARKRVDLIAKHLPTMISVASLGVKSKTPYLLLWPREALIWSTEELARCACDALENGDIAAGILLTRAVTESAAFVWRLKELIDTRHSYSEDALRTILNRMLFGWKNDEEFPEAINVNTLIDRMDKHILGVRARYATLSEFAHPNWSGVAGLFSSSDRANYTTSFGRALRGHESKKEMASALLAGSLELFEYAYNAISDALPKFIAELEPL